MRQGQFGGRAALGRIQAPLNERKALSSIIRDAGLDRQRRRAICNTLSITYRNYETGIRSSRVYEMRRVNALVTNALSFHSADM